MHKLPLGRERVVVDSIVPGGQGLGRLDNGQKVFVWNALPGETVDVRLTKNKHSYAEGTAEEIFEASEDRIAPREANFLATSPWQIMTFNAENRHKKAIVLELAKQQGITLPPIEEIITDDKQWRYRNKMEYSFWGDGQGLHLAMHLRGSHGKQIVEGSELALPVLDMAAVRVCRILDEARIRAGDMKTIIVRCGQTGNVVASLYSKIDKLPTIVLPEELQGLRVYYSNPKSPASVRTRLLAEYGDVRLTDVLLGRDFIYDVDSFFQVNVPVFCRALQRIKERCPAESVTDMYAGVGSIGLSVAMKEVELVEMDSSTAAMARLNAESSSLMTEVVEAPSEKMLERITENRTVIFDPPRAGLHDKVLRRLGEVKPAQLVYLSCNPATQMRDIAQLQHLYYVDFFESYNFFPRTPHIETLAVLRKRPEA